MPEGVLLAFAVNERQSAKFIGLLYGWLFDEEKAQYSHYEGEYTLDQVDIPKIMSETFIRLLLVTCIDRGRNVGHSATDHLHRDQK